VCHEVQEFRPSARFGIPPWLSVVKRSAFNHPQFSFNPVDDPAFAAQDASASNFGQITVSSVNPRLIQFVLKFLF
jgi:hypothetical protein